MPTPAETYLNLRTHLEDTLTAEERQQVIDAMFEAYSAMPRAGGVTPGVGFPYPSPTDPISQGADAIRLLAQASDYLKGISAVAASGVTTVTFSPAGFFTKPPIVLIFPYIAGNVGLAYMAGAPTAANFQVRCYTTAGAQVAGTAMWMAIPAP